MARLWEAITKVQVTFKHPDVTFDALEAVKNEDDHDKLERVFMKFIEFGEYLRVEFDTEAQTATVITCK
jgi:hypothetical protein